MFILILSSSCSKKLFEFEEKPNKISSVSTKSLSFYNIDTTQLRKVFKIHSSFEKNPNLFTRLASEIKYNVPGNKMMLNEMSSLKDKITIIYDPTVKSSLYHWRGYKSVLGKVIVRKTLELDNILEELYHAYWAIKIDGPDGQIPTDYKLNAEFDAKLYTIFVLSAQSVKRIPGNYDYDIPFLFGFYGQTQTLFAANMPPYFISFKYPPFPGAKCEIPQKLYIDLYDAFAKGVKYDECPYKDYKGWSGYSEGLNLIIKLINSRSWGD